MTEVWTKEQAKQYLAGNARLGKQKRAHKYGAKPKLVDGIKFPSTAEAKRYGELKLLERAGDIESLELQPRFPLTAVDGTTAAAYVADFRYRQWQPLTRGALSKIKVDVVEDVKGVLTKVYRLKIKLFKAQYPHLTFREIKALSRRRKKAKR